MRPKKKQGIFLPIIIFLAGGFLMYTMLYAGPAKDLEANKEEAAQIEKKTAESSQVSVEADQNAIAISKQALKSTDIRNNLNQAGIPTQNLTRKKNNYIITITGSTKQVAKYAAKMSGNIYVDPTSAQLAGEPPLFQIEAMSIKSKGLNSTLTATLKPIKKGK